MSTEPNVKSDVLYNDEVNNNAKTCESNVQFDNVLYTDNVNNDAEYEPSEPNVQFDNVLYNDSADLTSNVKNVRLNENVTCNTNNIYVNSNNMTTGAINVLYNNNLYNDAVLSECSDSVDECCNNVLSNLKCFNTSVCPNNDTPGLKCISWNINGLTDKLGYPHVSSLLTQFDLIFISESWLEIEKIDDPVHTIPGFTPNNFPRTHIHAKAHRASGGLILYVKDKIAKNVNVLKNICDHFIIVCINGYHEKIFLIFCYIPPQDSPHLCKSCDGNLIEMLFDLHAEYSSEGPVYLCGDLNGRTGQAPDFPSNYFYDDFIKLDDEPMFHGMEESDKKLSMRHSEDTKFNTQGRALLNLCKETDLRIVNGRHSLDKGLGKFTFYRGSSRSVNDYLISQCNNFDKILYFSVGDKMPESDHCPLQFKIKCDLIHNIPPPQNDNRPYTRFIWHPDLIDKFHENLFDPQGLQFTDDFYDSMESLMSPETVAKCFSSLIIQAAERSLKKTKPKQKKPIPSKSDFPCNKWFDTECKTKYSDLKLAHALTNKYGIYTDLELDTMEKEFKALVQKKKRSSKLKTTSELISTRNPTELWKKLESLVPKTKGSTGLSLQDFQNYYSKPAVNNDSNIHKFDLDHQKEIYHFIQSYTAEPSTAENNAPADGKMGENWALIQDFLNSLITEDELSSAIKKLKKGKSPGIDGIPIDLFIDCEKSLNPLLLDLFNYVLINEDYPAEWALGLVNPVPKGGPDLVENFRKITVLPAISKILETILNTRLEYIDKAFGLEDQYNGGFKKDSRTADNIFVLNGLIDRAKNTNSELYVCFVDFRRAFDCINRKFMFHKLIKQGYSSKTLRLIMNMYSKTKSTVKLNGLLAENPFEEVLGVAQGGVLSPYLFKSFLSDMAELFSVTYGVKIDEMTALCYLLWADDLVLFSESAQGLQDHLDKLYLYCSKWQLIVNNLKTKVLIFNKKKITKFFHRWDPH